MAHSEETIPGPVPLLVAATGHKNLLPQETAGIREIVRENMKSLISDLGMKPAEVRVLTGLAEGADTLVAEVALECGIPIVAVLPMPQDLYEEEFSTPETLAKFKELLGKASEQIVFPLEPGVTAAQVSLAGEKMACSPERNRQYVALGRYLAVSADVLIALWDGNSPTGQAGGTAHVVQLFLSRSGIDMGRLKAGALNPGDPGLLMHCKVSRKGSQPQPDAGSIRWLPTEDFCKGCLPASEAPNTRNQANHCCGAGERLVRKALREDRLHADHSGARHFSGRPEFSSLVESSMENLIPRDRRQALTQRELDALRRFGEPDSLAIHFQNRRDRYLRVLLALSFVAALCASLYSDCPLPKENWPGWLIGFFLSLASAYGVFLFKRGYVPILKWRFKDDPETAFEDYRALAEGMRVQLFWRLAGIRTCVSDHYLARQKEGLGWVCNGLRYYHLRLIADPDPTPASDAREDLARERWLINQRDWFRSKLAENPHKMTLKMEIKRWKRISALLFFGGLLMVAILLGDLKWVFLPEDLKWIFRFLMAFLPVCAGLMRFYIEITGMEETTEQYERILAVYDKACRLLPCGTAVSQASMPPPSDVYFQLGCEALAEHGDWLLFHRHNEVGVAV